MQRSTFSIDFERGKCLPYGFEVHRRKLRMVPARSRKEDLIVLRELINAGKGNAGQRPALPIE